MASFPDVPNFFFFSILSGIIVLILMEIFRPEILGFKERVRKNVNNDMRVNPLT